MSTDDQSPQHDQNVSAFGAESVTEMARLQILDRLINQAIGGHFPEQQTETIQRSKSILDVSCGPGAWALDVANVYPFLNVVGVDKREQMITYAQSQASLQALTNIRFQKMDVAKDGLKFPDQNFDLVNIRYAAVTFKREEWPAMLQECHRVTASGGLIRITEADLVGSTTSAAFEEYQRLAMQALRLAGYGFSPDGVTLGITPVLGNKVKQAGYSNVQSQAYTIDFSYGTPLHSDYRQSIAAGCKTVQPLLVQAGVDTQERIETIYHEMLTQISAKDFRGVGQFLIVWGER